MRTAKVVSISLPPDMNDEIARLAKEERRSVSEIFREALRQYMANKSLEEVRRQVKSKAKKGLTEDDIERIIDQGRKD